MSPVTWGTGVAETAYCSALKRAWVKGWGGSQEGPSSYSVARPDVIEGLRGGIQSRVAGLLWG